jgi:hypothetical protein
MTPEQQLQYQERKRDIRIHEVAILIALFVLVAVSARFVSSIVAFTSEGLFSPMTDVQDSLHRTLVEEPGIDATQSWMTFDYINRVYDLPPDALRTALRIVNPRYPRISVWRYSRDMGVDLETALTRVRKAIREARPRSVTPVP